MIALSRPAAGSGRLAARAEALAARVLETAPARPAWARLVAVSGVDAAGKGTVARETAAVLERRGSRVALVGLDDWLRPLSPRPGGASPGEDFYRNAFDFEEVFSRVLEPLRIHRTLQLAIERPHPFLGGPRRLGYDWNDVDVVLVEGIFLMRRDLRPRYDLRVWVDCPFETALARAVRRNQERLPASRLAADYAEIYFPAQKLHLERDRPREAAHVLIENGPAD